MKIRRSVAVALTVAGLVVVLPVAGILWVGYAFKESITPRVDPGLYEGIVRQRQGDGSVPPLFPGAIDKAAEATAFYHVPGFLQGGDVVALRMRLPRDKIAEIQRQLQKSGREEITNTAVILDPLCYPMFGIKRPSTQNLFEGMGPLPADFQVFLYRTDLDALKSNPNHGYVGFTAISTNLSEVLYYSDSW